MKPFSKISHTKSRADWLQCVDGSRWLQNCTKFGNKCDASGKFKKESQKYESNFLNFKQSMNFENSLARV